MNGTGDSTPALEGYRLPRSLTTRFPSDRNELSLRTKAARAFDDGCPPGGGEAQEQDTRYQPGPHALARRRQRLDSASDRPRAVQQHQTTAQIAAANTAFDATRHWAFPAVAPDHADSSAVRCHFPTPRFEQPG